MYYWDKVHENNKKYGVGALYEYRELTIFSSKFIDKIENNLKSSKKYRKGNVKEFHKKLLQL